MPSPGARLDAAFFARDTRVVARELIGAVLAHGGVAGRIVETEAYRGDAASHYVMRPKTAQMMGTTYAHLYVYRIYGMHHCVNVTTEDGRPGAVLLRALEPLEGLDTMRARRGGRRDAELASGPARLAVALGIGPEMNGSRFDADLTWTARLRRPRIVAGTRVGITRAAHLPWRFRLADSPWTSRARGAT